MMPAATVGALVGAAFCAAIEERPGTILVLISMLLGMVVALAAVRALDGRL